MSTARALVRNIFRSGLSRCSNGKEATLECIKEIQATSSANQPFNFLMYFENTEKDEETIPELLLSKLNCDSNTVILGTRAPHGLIGPSDELEGLYGLSVLAGYLPNCKILPFHNSTLDGLPSYVDEDSSWAQYLGEEKQPDILMFQNSRSRQTDNFLRYFDNMVPNATKIGGLIDQPKMFVGNQFQYEGVAGVSIHGDVRVKPIVCQGALPIGPKFQVRQIHGDALIQLDNMSAGDALGATLRKYRDSFTQGYLVALYTDNSDEYLLRHVFEFGRDGLVRLGVVQHILPHVTHVQLAAFSSENARNELYQRLQGNSTPLAYYRVSCVGRGMNLFPTPDLEALVASELWPGIPATGFFAMGEIGTITNRTLNHGYTTSIGAFYEV